MNQKLFDYQCYLNLLLTIVLAIIDIRNLFLLIFVILILGLNFFFSKTKNFYECTASVISLLSSTLFMQILVNCVNFLNHQKILSQTFLASIYLILLLMLYLPTVLKFFPSLKTPIFQLISIQGLLLPAILIKSIDLYGSTTLLSTLVQSRFFLALALLIVVPFILKSWAIKNLNFKMVANLLIVIVVMLLLIWFAFFNSLANFGQNLSEILWEWKNNLTLYNFTLDRVNWVLEAALFEEIIRVLDIIVLLKLFPKQKFRITLTIFASAILFALPHSLYLHAGSPINYVVGEVIFTFIGGLMYACLYLYSGKIYLLMVVHFLVDFIVLAEPQLTAFNVGPLLTESTLGLVVRCLVELVPVLLLTIFTDHDKLEKNLNQLVNADPVK